MPRSILSSRRSNLLHPVALLIVSLASMGGLTGQETTQSLELVSRRQLFVDSWLVDDLANVRLMLHAPVDEGAVVQFDKPWEGPFCGYCTVIRDGELFRLYYRGRPDKGADGDIGEVKCYAESHDGLTWSKPNVNQFVAKGQAENNIILADAGNVSQDQQRSSSWFGNKQRRSCGKSAGVVF